MNESICANCDAVLEGEYCAACGQRRFRPRDRRMAHLLGESFVALTEFDGRIWRSLRAALLQPGRIARDWIEGRRARWISPVRLFLLANLLYFLAPLDALPDWLLAVGLLDDLAVLRWVMQRWSGELDAFRVWLQGRSADQLARLEHLPDERSSTQ